MGQEPTEFFLWAVEKALYLLLCVIWIFATICVAGFAGPIIASLPFGLLLFSLYRLTGGM